MVPRKLRCQDDKLKHKFPPHHEEELSIESGRALEQLSVEVVESPSLETSPAYLDVFMHHLLWVTLPWRGVGGLDDLCFQPQLFWDSVRLCPTETTMAW